MARSWTRSSPRRRPRRPPQAPPLLSTQQPLFVVGRGNLGRTLATALNAAGHPALLVPGRRGRASLIRSLKSLPNAIVFVSVPDDAVSTFAEALAEAGSPIPATVAFVHLSGALQLNALEPLRARHSIGSFHPLQSFPAPRPPSSLRGIVVAVDASTTALRRRLAGLARALGAKPRHVDDSQRAIYHAAAVFASNYIDVMLAKAVELLREAGWSEREALEGVVPLAEGVLASVRARGPVAALTGPVRRGDVNTVERHLAALRGAPVAHLYRMLGLIALEIAVEAGLEPAAAERMHRALTQKVAATRRRRRP